MRILVAHNRYTARGGEDTVFDAEIAMLEANGHSVIRYEENNRRIESMGLLSTATSAIWSRDSRQKIAALLAAEKPDIAHFHNTFPLISPSAYYACAGAGVPVIQTLHNYRLLCPAATLMRQGQVCEKCIGRRFTWPAIAHACYQDSRAKSAGVTLMLGVHQLLKTWQNTVDGYIALTEFSKAKFIEGGLPADKLFIKPNFMDEALAGAPEYGADYLLFIGRLSEEKGVDLLIEAMSQARDVPIKIIGDGPLGDTMDREIQRHQLTNVERLGLLPHNDTLVYLDAAACLVLPSKWHEGFPMTIVEAYSRGVPVIAPYLGSMIELIEDQRTGLHFDSGDVTQLAERIRWAWANKPALQQMGQNAFQVYSDKYTVRRNYELLMSIYQDVMARNKLKIR